MSDPRTFWLVVTNIMLGVVVIALFLVVAIASAFEMLRRLQVRRSVWRELNGDMERYFGCPHTRK